MRLSYSVWEGRGIKCIFHVRYFQLVRGVLGCDPVVSQGASVLRRCLLAFPGRYREKKKAPRCPFPAEAITLAANQKGHPRVGSVWETETGHTGTEGNEIVFVVESGFSS